MKIAADVVAGRVAKREAYALGKATREIEAAKARAGDLSYWIGRWEKGQTGWTRFEEAVDPTVRHNLYHLARGGPLAPPLLAPTLPLAGSRVLVPLCGNSPSLDWFFRVGQAHVVGVEIDGDAIDTVVKRIGLDQWDPKQEVTLKDGTTCIRWATKGKKEAPASLVLLQGDFFSIVPSLLTAGASGSEADCGPGFDLVYDRAAFVALPPVLREWYAERITQSMRAAVDGPAGGTVSCSGGTDATPYTPSTAEAVVLAAPLLRPWCPSIVFETCFRGKEYMLTSDGLPEGPPFHCDPHDIHTHYFHGAQGFDDEHLYMHPTAPAVLAALNDDPEFQFHIYGVYRTGACHHLSAVPPRKKLHNEA